MVREPGNPDAGEATSNDCAMSRAVASWSLPPWLAVTVQVPAAMGVRVGPETVQIRGVSDRNATSGPDVADAVSVTASPTFACGGGGKVIVCSWCPALTWSDSVMFGATR